MRIRKRFLVIPLCLVAVGGVLIWRHASVDAPPVQPTAPADGRYVAMGDSVAAGLGLKTPSDWQFCGRTNESYPYLVAQDRNLKLQDLACRNATFPKGVNGTQDSNGLTLPPQIDALKTGTKPKLITITSGANDVNWGEVVGRCYSGSCGTLEDTARITQALSTLSASISQVLTTIQERYPDDTPRTVLTGYYQVLPNASGATCLDAANITDTERAWWTQQTYALNTLLQQTAQSYGFARFAPVDFSGHDSCSADPYVQGLTDKAPFHPTAAGQQAMAQAVLKQAR